MVISFNITLIVAESKEKVTERWFNYGEIKEHNSTEEVEV
jgi:hypothetical protein